MNLQSKPCKKPYILSKKQNTLVFLFKPHLLILFLRDIPLALSISVEMSRAGAQKSLTLQRKVVKVYGFIRSCLLFSHFCLGKCSFRGEFLLCRQIPTWLQASPASCTTSSHSFLAAQAGKRELGRMSFPDRQLSTHNLTHAQCYANLERL